jgi:hypothetical protein
MYAILLEGVLFVVLVAATATLVWHLLLRRLLTRSGVARRRRQTENRRRIEREWESTCPIHGAQREDDLVLLPSGERICPVCYKEALHG